MPILTAGMLFGDTWHNKYVLILCDNQPVVEVVNLGSSRDPGLAQLPRCLFFITAVFQITLRATHIVGRNSVQADAISRNNLSVFFSQVPNAAHHLPFLQP